jgi:5-methyltetrahydrofolate--homocysteine methyltransferase
MTDKEIVINNINKNEVARYLGYKDTLPDVAMTKIILECEEKLRKAIKPRYCYKIFELKSVEDGVLLEGTELVLKGESISNHLKDCEKAVVMCATLSGEVDKMLRFTEPQNMINTIVTDALANVCIEQVCDEVEKIIQSENEGYNLTWRFGVGYGDFPITTQNDFLQVLDAGKRIGVCATESSILTPKKSVTCVIGLSKKEINSKKSCDNCNLSETCEYRKNGTSCN